MRSQIRQLAKPLRQKPVVHWEGVYENAAAVPVAGAGFASQAWIDAALRDTELTATQGPKAPTPSDSQLLATLVTQYEPPVRILDFGGGMGIGYLRLRAALAKPVDVRYEIVDGAESCFHTRPAMFL